MLSLIIVNFRNPALLRLALTSLARTSNELPSHEVIVVDSASTPETRNVFHDCAALFSSARLVPFVENVGYTRGVNEGLRVAEGEYLCVLNPDIVVLPGACATLLQYLHEHPTVGLVGPGLLNMDDTRQQSFFRFYTPSVILRRRLPWINQPSFLRHFLMSDIDVSKPTPVDWLMGSALMTTRTALDRVGLLDESLFLYLSEVDWAWRFWENGLVVAYVPTATMYHYHQRQSKGRFGIFDLFFRQETRWHIADAFRYFRKHGIRGIRPQASQNQPSLLSTS